MRVESILGEFTSCTLQAAEAAIYKFDSKVNNVQPKEFNTALLRRIEALEEEVHHLKKEKTTL